MPSHCQQAFLGGRGEGCAGFQGAVPVGCGAGMEGVGAHCPGGFPVPRGRCQSGYRHLLTTYCVPNNYDHFYPLKWEDRETGVAGPSHPPPHSPAPARVSLPPTTSHSNILPLILLYLCFSFILLSPCFHSLILIHSTLPGTYSKTGTEPAVATCTGDLAPAPHSSSHSKEKDTEGTRLRT